MKKIVLITGFLGSGKTTFLNSLLENLNGIPAGLIVNDFGDIGIDSSLISSGKNKMIELNGGQVFCSCISGNFVEAILSYAALDVEYLLVETSGLAKPTAIYDILGAVEKKSPGTFAFSGLLCIIDASSFLQLKTVINALEEQLWYCDNAIINKCDLVAEDMLLEIEKDIKLFRADLDLYRTEHGKVPANYLNDLKTVALADLSPTKRKRDAYLGWGKPGRPVPFVLTSATPVDTKSAQTFFAAIAPDILRAKGFLKSTSGTIFIDYAGNKLEIEMKKPLGETEKVGVMVITHKGKEQAEQIQKAWELR